MFAAMFTRSLQRAFAPTPSFTPRLQIQTNLLTNFARDFHIKLKGGKKVNHYKFRPHHASVKRYWQTGSGMLMRFKAGMNHKRRRKTKSQLRRLSQRVEIPRQHYRRVSKMLGIAPKNQLPPGQHSAVNRFWQPPVDASKINVKRWC